MKKYSDINPWPSHLLEDIHSCPVCGSLTRIKLYSNLFDRINSAPGLWSLQRCTRCQTCFLDPRPTRHSLGLAYANYYTHSLAEDLLCRRSPSVGQRLRNGYLDTTYCTSSKHSFNLGNLLFRSIPFLRSRADYLYRYLPPPSTSNNKLLDIGCGNGSFLNLMMQIGWVTLGIEPDIKAVKSARKLGLNVIHGTLEETTLPAASFDAVTLNHVIEHLHDPLQALRQCRALLKPKGHISVFTPNVNSIGSRFFKEDWYALHPPCHLVLFTQNSLVYALTQAGFSDIRIHPSNPYGFPASVNASINNRPRVRVQGLHDRIYSSKVFVLFMQYLCWLRSSISEEVVVTAKA
jgi:2-polyprenyl-3-methyl-5-hydroxy-6-metoxy-1,4-benzoquinol methylase